MVKTFFYPLWKVLSREEVSNGLILVYWKAVHTSREENFMLTKTQMQQIQNLKLIGCVKMDIIRYYEVCGEKPPSCAW